MTRAKTVELPLRAMDPPAVVFKRVADAALLGAEVQQRTAEAELRTLETNPGEDVTPEAIETVRREIAQIVDCMRRDVDFLRSIVGVFLPLEIERLTVTQQRDELAPMAEERARQIATIQRLNEGSEVTPEVRAQTIALDKELVAAFPVKSHRYEEIDRRHAWKRGRARYIIEGPRKSKKK